VSVQSNDTYRILLNPQWHFGHSRHSRSLVGSVFQDDIEFGEGEWDEMWYGEHIGPLYVAGFYGLVDIVPVTEDMRILPLFRSPEDQ